MNINLLFDNLKHCLQIAEEQIDAGNYRDAKKSLQVVNSHLRELLERVKELIALKN